MRASIRTASIVTPVRHGLLRNRREAIFNRMKPSRSASITSSIPIRDWLRRAKRNLPPPAYAYAGNASAAGALTETDGPSPAEAAIGPDPEGPAGTRHIGLAGFALGIERVELDIEVMLGRCAGVSITPRTSLRYASLLACYGKRQNSVSMAARYQSSILTTISLPSSVGKVWASR
jgi:hypothetical protein